MQVTHFCDLMKLYYLVMNRKKNTTYKNKSNAFSPFIDFYILEQPTKDDDLHINIHLYTYMSVYVCIFLCFFVMITLSILVYTQLQIGNIYG